MKFLISLLGLLVLFVAPANSFDFPKLLEFVINEKCTIDSFSVRRYKRITLDFDSIRVDLTNDSNVAVWKSRPLKPIKLNYQFKRNERIVLINVVKTKIK
jgi:hypothetical protein